MFNQAWKQEWKCKMNRRKKLRVEVIPVKESLKNSSYLSSIKWMVRASSRLSSYLSLGFISHSIMINPQRSWSGCTMQLSFATTTIEWWCTSGNLKFNSSWDHSLRRSNFTTRMMMKLITMSRAWACLRTKKTSKRKSKEEGTLLLQGLLKRIANIEGGFRVRKKQ